MYEEDPFLWDPIPDPDDVIGEEVPCTCLLIHRGNDYFSLAHADEKTDIYLDEPFVGGDGWEEELARILDAHDIDRSNADYIDGGDVKFVYL